MPVVPYTPFCACSLPSLSKQGLVSQWTHFLCAILCFSFGCNTAHSPQPKGDTRMQPLQCLNLPLLLSLSENILPLILVPKSCSFWTTGVQKQRKSIYRRCLVLWIHAPPKNTANASPILNQMNQPEWVKPSQDFLSAIYRSKWFHLEGKIFPLHCTPPTPLTSPSGPLPRLCLPVHPYLGQYPLGLVDSSTGGHQEAE